MMLIHPRKIVTTLLLAVSMSLLASCVTQPTPTISTLDRKLLARFASGASVLDCEGACSSTYVHSQADIWSRYDAQDWQGLALLILHIRWRRDITYFFLGAAAQGLGHLEAADRYYRFAGALASSTRPMNRCASIYELCGPLSLPQDIYPRLAAVDQLLASRNKHIGSAPSLPLWIDPPSQP